MTGNERKVYYYVWVWCKKLPAELESHVSKDGFMNILKDGLRSLSLDVADGCREPRFTVLVYGLDSDADNKVRVLKISSLLENLSKSGKVMKYASRSV